MRAENKEHRRHDRIKHSAQVDFSDGNFFLTGEIRDLSLGGMQIESMKKVETGTKITVILSVGATIKIKGIVRWVRRQGIKYFIGVQFVDVGPELESGIREVIQAMFWQAAKA